MRRPDPHQEPDRPRSDRRGWRLLLAIPVGVPLLTPLINRHDPTLFGFPFFYWFQLAFVVATIGILIMVLQLTKSRR